MELRVDIIASKICIRIKPSYLIFEFSLKQLSNAILALLSLMKNESFVLAIKKLEEPQALVQIIDPKENLKKCF